MTTLPTYTIAIAGHHLLIRKGLISLINSFDGFSVLFESDSRDGVVQNIGNANLPDVIILDINMPNMEGYESAEWLRKNYPEVRILALTMQSDKFSVLNMLRSGVNGYISTSAHPDELRNALVAVIRNGFYLPYELSGAIINEISRMGAEQRPIDLIGAKELQFLELLSKGMSYKEIASKMYLSPRTLDDYKKSISKKTGVKNRIELVSYAIKNGLVKIM